jgi:hypothetical protein
MHLNSRRSTEDHNIQDFRFPEYVRDLRITNNISAYRNDPKHHRVPTYPSAILKIITFSARIQSPTSKVGNMDLDGMDLGSARDEP